MEFCKIYRIHIIKINFAILFAFIKYSKLAEKLTDCTDKKDHRGGYSKKKQGCQSFRFDYLIRKISENDKSQDNS